MLRMSSTSKSSTDISIDLTSPNAFLRKLMLRNGMIFPERANILYYINAGVHILLIGVLFFGIMSYLFFVEVPLYVKMQPLSFLVSLIHIASKHVNFMLQPNIVKRLLDEGDEFRKELGGNEIYKELFDQDSKRCHTIARIFFGLFHFMIFMSCTVSLGNKLIFGFANVPFELYYFLDANDYFYLIFSIEALSVVAGAYSICTSYVFSFTVTDQIATVMKILQIKLETEEFTTSLNDLHVRILSYVHLINKLFGLVFLVEFVISYIQGCCAAYSLMKSIQMGDPKALARLTQVLCCVAMPYIICACGERVSQASDDLLETIYRCKWIDSDTKTRRNVLLMFTAATKPLHVHYKYLMSFGMAQYLAVMQGTFTYITVLRTFFDSDT